MIDSQRDQGAPLTSRLAGEGKGDRTNPTHSDSPHFGNTPALSIVIPTYNGRRVLAACLASVEKNAPVDLPIEVIVVDDASTDGIVEWLSEEHPWVRVIALESNGGFCRAANAGIAAATGTVIQLLNDDTEVTPG